MRPMPQLQDHEIPENRAVKRPRIGSVTLDDGFERLPFKVPSLNASRTENEIVHQLVQVPVRAQPYRYRQPEAVLRLGANLLRQKVGIGGLKKSSELPTAHLHPCRNG